MTEEFDVAAIKKVHEDARKKAQYGRQAAKQREMREGVQRYKELYPEFFTELSKQAKREAKQEIEEETSLAPTIVFTGALSITREHASQLAENAGYKVSNHVSKNTTYVVVGENPGSKLHKATQLDTDIINEEDFHALLKGEKPACTTTSVCRKCGYKLPDQLGMFARISGGFTCPICHTQNKF